jgi:hypothetical protein
VTQLKGWRPNVEHHTRGRWERRNMYALDLEWHLSTRKQCRELRTLSLVMPITKQKRVYKNPTYCLWTNTGKPQERRRCIVCRQLKERSMPDAGGSSTILVAACVDGPKKRSCANLHCTHTISKPCKLRLKIQPVCSSCGQQKEYSMKS